MTTQDERTDKMVEQLQSCAALLEVIAEDAKEAGDTVTWAMASVAAENARKSLPAPPESQKE